MFSFKKVYLALTLTISSASLIPSMSDFETYILQLAQDYPIEPATMSHSSYFTLEDIESDEEGKLFALHLKHTFEEVPLEKNTEMEEDKLSESSESAAHSFHSSSQKERRIKTKNFHCSFKGCNKSFATQECLNMHSNTHSGKRPFKCPVLGCKKTYAWSTSLMTHLTTFHNSQTFTCPQKNCAQSFESAYRCQQHKRLFRHYCRKKNEK